MITLKDIVASNLRQIVRFLKSRVLGVKLGTDFNREHGELVLTLLPPPNLFRHTTLELKKIHTN